MLKLQYKRKPNKGKEPARATEEKKTNKRHQETAAPETRRETTSNRTSDPFLSRPNHKTCRWRDEHGRKESKNNSHPEVRKKRLHRSGGAGGCGGVRCGGGWLQQERTRKKKRLCQLVLSRYRSPSTQVSGQSHFMALCAESAAPFKRRPRHQPARRRFR